jgi:hypothetical protein
MHLRLSAPQAFALSALRRGQGERPQTLEKPLTLTLSQRERGKKQSLKTIPSPITKS